VDQEQVKKARGATNHAARRCARAIAYAFLLLVMRPFGLRQIFRRPWPFTRTVLQRLELELFLRRFGMSLSVVLPQEPALRTGRPFARVS
jgi:hypothetical protein